MIKENISGKKLLVKIAGHWLVNLWSADIFSAPKFYFMRYLRVTIICSVRPCIGLHFLPILLENLFQKTLPTRLFVFSVFSVSSVF